MNFVQIRYFLAVAETLSFTRAAQVANVSQPALSKAIRKLEDDLGSPLLDRSTQHVVLTTFGRKMLVHFEQIDENLRKARAAARNASGAQREELNIGVMCTVGPGQLGEFLCDFAVKRPDVDLIFHDVTADATGELMLAGALDCVFCVQDIRHDSRFSALTLFHEDMVVAFPDGHRFATYEAVPLSEVAAEAYLDRLHCEFRETFFRETRASGLELNVNVRSEREDWILALIGFGAGVSVMSEHTASQGSAPWRPIAELREARRMELVHAVSAETTGAYRAFREAAEAWDWRAIR